MSVGAAPAAGVEIRPAVAGDLPAIRDIYNHYVRESTVTFDEIETTLADWETKAGVLAAAGLPFLVAEDTGPETEDGADRVIGYALLQHWRPKSAYRFSVEDSIYLRPGAGGRGLGRVLLSALLDAGTAAGLREVIAVIEPTAAAGSIALHRRFGFEEAGRLERVGVKFGRSLDVLFLQKSL
ncbi:MULTISPECIES: GNAT family N-acetyltransferase [unclassified Microbacterium]|uniref:GNAT family N-acetyltransferase n=1 Tax=unclassified Microbacterium TaxID=2609290 RepID=UPI00301039DC